MLRGKSIISFVLALLLLLGGHSRVSNSPELSCNSSTRLVRTNSSPDLRNLPGNINNHSVKKEWIKIRYKGGEFKYDNIVSTFSISSFAFADDYKAACYYSFTSSYCPFLLSLRGPPIA